MTAPTIDQHEPLMTPCPDWCNYCRVPDVGVVDHYSRIWEGSDYGDNTKWRIQVVQTVNANGPDLAYIDVLAGEGAYRSVAEFTRALMQAETLKNRINADRITTIRQGGAR